MEAPLDALLLGSRPRKVGRFIFRKMFALVNRNFLGWDAVTGFGSPNFPKIMKLLGLNYTEWNGISIGA